MVVGGGNRTYQRREFNLVICLFRAWVGLQGRHMSRVGQNHKYIYTYIWCIYGNFGREITIYTVYIYTVLANPTHE